jgi:rhodanese-related sulfurtransferase
MRPINISHRTCTHAVLPGLFLLFGCGAPVNTGTLDPVSFQQAIGPKVQLIDVRTPAEFAEGHLVGARNLDWSGGALETAMPGLEKGAPVLLYCASGRRSAAAREAMKAAGFSDVKDLEGGIRAWSAAGLPTNR